MASVQRLHAAAKMRIGDLLVSEGLITPEQLSAALSKQASSGRRLGRLLVDLGFVSERDVALAIGEQLGIRGIITLIVALAVIAAGSIFAGRIKARVVDLQTGEYTDAHDAQLFDPLKAARDPMPFVRALNRAARTR